MSNIGEKLAIYPKVLTMWTCPGPQFRKNCVNMCGV